MDRGARGRIPTAFPADALLLALIASAPPAAIAPEPHGRDVITFYELPISSLMSVPGARVAPLKKIVSGNVDGFWLPEEAWREAA